MMFMNRNVMNHVERFRLVMNFQPVDRFPRWEWAMWWDKTIERWHGEGLPAQLSDVFDISQYFGLDPYKQFWFSTTESTIEAVQHHVEGVVECMDDYLALRPKIFPEHQQAISEMGRWAAQQNRGEVVVWTTLEGFFWFPRTLMGFERFMLAYEDQPELVHTICEDLLNYNVSLINKLEKHCVPVFTTIAEDMSYNNGPMISRAIFDEYMAPYYKRLIARLKESNIMTIVDTDGDVTLLVPWMQSVGVDGVLPLEYQAGVDASALRRQYPDLRMIGHYNKLIMNQGELCMRQEFERLLPIMKTGGFIPSVDHQTPPAVSLEQYRAYLQLLEEYT